MNYHNNRTPINNENISHTTHIACAPPVRVQGFVKEMTEIAQMKWLNEFYTSKDKKGVIAKVRILILW